MSNPSALALAELLRQHAALRIHIDDCEQLADELDAGRGAAEPLIREVARLRVAFEHHNEVEEQVLRPILREAGSFGEVRIGRLVSDHIDEHRAMRDRLATGPTAELRATLATLREHLASEERSFVSSRIVRDDRAIEDRD